jgi:hypothetical protein
MGGFLGIGHSSAKTDRGNQLAGVSADWNVYNRGLPLSDTQSKMGAGQEAKGVDTLDTAKQYWSDITQGNRTALQSAAAPQANAIQQRADAAKREQSQMGTARGGGLNAENQQVQQNQEKQLATNEAAVQPEAAKQLGQVGQAQANIGHQQMAEALQALGLSADVAKEIIQSSIESRPISMAANKAVTQQWSNALAAIGL